MWGFVLIENATLVAQVFHTLARAANNKSVSMRARVAGNGQLLPTRIHSRGAG